MTSLVFLHVVVAENDNREGMRIFDIGYKDVCFSPIGSKEVVVGNLFPLELLPLEVKGEDLTFSVNFGI